MAAGIERTRLREETAGHRARRRPGKTRRRRRPAELGHKYACIHPCLQTNRERSSTSGTRWGRSAARISRVPLDRRPAQRTRRRVGPGRHHISRSCVRRCSVDLARTGHRAGRRRASVLRYAHNTKSEIPGLVGTERYRGMLCSEGQCPFARTRPRSSSFYLCSWSLPKVRVLCLVLFYRSIRPMANPT